jgi:hypothetical protein
MAHYINHLMVNNHQRNFSTPDQMNITKVLGMLNIKPVKLELIDGAKPYNARPFPVPQSLESTTKTEMKRLTDIDVFNRSSDYEWAAPTFIQAKKTGDV